jgi:phosphatidate cytidylyltransferase
VIQLAEMSDLSDRMKHAKRLGFLGLICFVIEPLWLVFGIFIWTAMIREIGTNYLANVSKSKMFFVQTAMTLLMSLIVTLGVINMVQLRFNGWVGTGILFVNIITVVASDSLQYVIGNKYGKHPLSRFSPNKTKEGFAGGTPPSAIIGIATLLIWSIFVDFGENFGWLLVLVAVTPLVATAGDLYESALKRMLDIKDFSNILGSHGGVTDRFDANMLVHATIASIQLQLIV